MTEQELIDDLQRIIDQNMGKVLINIHAGYLIHAVKFLKEQESARKLTLDEVIALPPDQDVWIQHRIDGLFKDLTEGIVAEPKIYFKTGAKHALDYGKSWITWDKMPTQEQFETAFD